MADTPAVSTASRAAICHGLQTVISLLEAMDEHVAAGHVKVALGIVGDRPTDPSTLN
jgi:hypothetical protein